MLLRILCIGRKFGNFGFENEMLLEILEQHE